MPRTIRDLDHSISIETNTSETMSSSTSTQLMSSPFRLATVSVSTPPIYERIRLDDCKANPKASPGSLEAFPIAQLPYELRQLIYTYYFASLSTQEVTCPSAGLPHPHHSLTPLAQSSPFLECDPVPKQFYRNATFSFSCPEALKSFSTALSSAAKNVDGRKDVRKVKIVYGRYSQPTRDWVFLLTSNFPWLEEVTFAMDGEKSEFGAGHGCFGNWWGCVRDAVREGLSCAPGVGGRKGAVTLRVEDGEWGVVEVVCFR